MRAVVIIVAYNGNKFFSLSIRPLLTAGHETGSYFLMSAISSSGLCGEMPKM